MLFGAWIDLVFWPFVALMRATCTYPSITEQNLSRQHPAHDLDRPFGDHEAAGIAPHLRDRQLGGKSHAAMDLHAAVGNPKAELSAGDFRHIAFMPCGNARIRARGQLIN